jgi:DNA-binding NtrC family response regulator
MRLSSEAMGCLVRARWDGNVRELRNLIESLVVLAPQPEIGPEQLPSEYRDPACAGPAESQTPPGVEPVADTLTMDEIERRAILQALEKTGGNRTQAAVLLGIGLRTLQRKLKEYGGTD